MFAAIPYGQFVGGLVGAAVWLVVAGWFFLFKRPLLRKKVARGQLAEAVARPQIYRAPAFGVLFIAMALSEATITLDQADFFGESVLPPLVSTVICVGALVFFFKRKRAKWTQWV
jgi:hypothetical protein